MTIGLLEERLQNLSVDTPDAGRVAALVLSRASRRRTRRLPRALGAGAATIALLVLVAYFVPAADLALANVPVAGEVLRYAGLVGAADRITAVGAVSTSSGYRLKLVAAYADSSRTVLLLNADPPIQPATSVTLTDQFGRTYQWQNGTSDSNTGAWVMQFEGPAWPDSVTGARLTLHFSQLQ